MNNTTVEVTFEDAVADLNALNFAIEGLTISNKSVKQTNSKTVVLTTSAQTADVEYTVSVNEEKIGKFKGVSAVIPTAIDVTTKSIQGVLGKEVTVSAKVTVAAGQSAAGIPVTFNIPQQGSLANVITAEAVTNADGVASYNYTRYTAVTDDVVAYATGDRTKFSAGKVYWATAAQLTVKDVTGVTSLANNDKKVYQIESAKNADKFVFVAFNENVGVTADKVVRTVHAEGSRTYLLNSNNSVNETTNLGAQAHPYEITTGSKAVIAVKLDSKGKANLVLTGANGTVTPVVYEGIATDSIDAGTIAGDLLAEFTNASYNPTALQAKASTVKFEVKHSLGLTIEAQGVANAATYKNTNEIGGRDYTVTYIDKDGKPAPATTAVQVAIPVQQASNGVFLVDADGNKVQGVTSGEYRLFPITVRGKEGKATFTVSSELVTQYVEPIAFIDNGTGVGTKAGLDTTDLQAKGAATHFTEAVEYKSSLKLVDAAGDEIKSVYANGTEAANFQYDTVDQNGKPRAYRLADGTTPSTNVTFSVTAGTSSVTAGGRTVTAGNPQTFNATVQGGRTSTTLAVTSLAPTTATVSATASVAGLVLATTNSVTATFTNTSTANVTGAVTVVNKVTGVVTIGNVPYSLVGATYLNNGTVVPTLAAFYDHITVGKEVSVTKDKDGNLVFNVKGEGSNGTVSGSVLERANFVILSSGTVAELATILNADSEFAKLSAADKIVVATAVKAAAPVTGYATTTALSDAIEKAIYDEYVDQLETVAAVPATYANIIALVKKIPGASAAATALGKVTDTDIQDDIITDLATISATDAAAFVTEVNAAISKAVADANAGSIQDAIDAVEAAIASLSSPSTQAELNAVVKELRDNATILGLNLTAFDALSSQAKKNAVIEGLSTTFANAAVLNQELTDLVKLAADAKAPTVSTIELDGSKLIVTFNENVESSAAIAGVDGGKIKFLDGKSDGSATVASATIADNVLTITLSATTGLKVDTSVTDITLTAGGTGVDITDLAIPTANKATLSGLNIKVAAPVTP